MKKMAVLLFLLIAAVFLLVQSDNVNRTILWWIGGGDGSNRVYEEQILNIVITACPESESDMIDGGLRCRQ